MSKLLIRYGNNFKPSNLWMTFVIRVYVCDVCVQACVCVLDAPLGKTDKEILSVDLGCIT